MIAALLALAIGTPLPGRVVYVCAGVSDARRSEWTVWDAVTARRCRVWRE